MKKPGAPQPPPLQQPHAQPPQPMMARPHPSAPRALGGPLPKPLDVPPIVGQVAVLLGLLLALYAVVAPKISAADGKGARVAEREYSNYIQRRVIKYGKQVRDEQEAADSLLEKEGKKKKSFADKDSERRKRVRTFENQLENDFSLSAKRRAAANAAGSGDAKPWLLSVGFVGLVMFSLGSLLLMWQAPLQVSKVSYLIMLVIGLLVGGIGLNAPSAGLPDANAVKRTKRNTTALILRETIPLPSSHGALSWGMSLTKVEAKIKLGKKTTRDGVDTYATAEDKAGYGFRNGRLVQVGLKKWDAAELDTVFAGIGEQCSTPAMKIHAGIKGDTVIVRLNDMALFLKATDPAATKMMEQMRALCATLNKQPKTTP